MSIAIQPDFIFVNVAFVKLAADQLMALAGVLKSYDARFAPLKSTRGPCKYPPTMLYFEGNIGGVSELNVIPPDRVLINVAVTRFALVSTVLLKSRLVKFTLDKSTLAPIR